MLTQIYESATPEEAAALSAIGIDHIGVLVGDGTLPRELPLAAAIRVAGGITPPSRFSALFLTVDLSLIEPGHASSARKSFISALPRSFSRRPTLPA